MKERMLLWHDIQCLPQLNCLSTHLTTMLNNLQVPLCKSIEQLQQVLVPQAFLRPVHHPGLHNTKVLARSSDTAPTRSAPPSGNPVIFTCGFRCQRAREAVRRSEERHPGRAAASLCHSRQQWATPAVVCPTCLCRQKRAGRLGSGAAAICPRATLVRSARTCLYAVVLQPSPLFANPCRHRQSSLYSATTLVPKPQVRAGGEARANEPHRGAACPHGGAKWPCPADSECPFHTAPTAEEHACGLVTVLRMSRPGSQAPGGSPSATARTPAFKTGLAQAGRAPQVCGPRGEVPPPSFASRRRCPRPPRGGGVFAGPFCFSRRAAGRAWPTRVVAAAAFLHLPRHATRWAAAAGVLRGRLE